MLQDGITLTDSSKVINLQVDSGTSLPTSGGNVGELFYLTSGVVGLYSFNGTAWSRVGEDTMDTTYELVSSIQGKPTASANVLNFVATRAFTLPVSLTGSRARSGTATTAAATFTIKKNGSSIGSVTFPSSQAVGTFTFASQQTFAIGDLLQVSAPSTQDATLSDISIALKASTA